MKKVLLNPEENRYRYRNEQELQEAYGPPPKPITNLDLLRSLFGKPPDVADNSEEENPFPQENIIPVRIDGFGKNLDQPHIIHIHKKLEPLVQSVFAHIQNFNHSFSEKERYYLKADEQTNGYSHRDRLIDDGKRVLSFHAWGIALDLNRDENRGGDDWSVPGWVVRIFQAHGFRWGGYDFDQKGRRKADHFEYALTEILPAIPLSIPVFPFAPNEATSEAPLKNYHRNEANIGGYFPFAINNEALHGGIHIHPDVPSRVQSVRAPLPGYIVAARLSPSNSNTEYDTVRYAGNHTGFVLIRHRIRKVPESEDPNDAEEWQSCYSLYMHLKAIDVNGLNGNLQYHWKQADWVRKLYEHRHGSIVAINTPEDIGKQGGLHELCDNEPESVKIFAEKEWLPQEIVAGTEQGPNFLLKPPPKELEKVLEAFEKGDIITFTQPYLTVEQGEIIGFVQSPPAHGNSPLARFKQSLPEQIRSNFRSGFLHWEFFTPEGETTLNELLAMIGVTGTDVEEAAEEGNKIDREKLNELLNTLDAGQAEESLNKLKERLNDPEDPYAEYGLELARFLNDPAGLAKEGENDLITANSITGASFPVRLTLHNLDKTVPKGKEYNCDIIFESNGKAVYQKTVSLKPEGEITEFDIRIPVKTERIVLQSEEIGFEWIYKIEEQDPWIATLIKNRWRDRILIHDNEWHDENVTTFVEKRKEDEKFSADVSAEHLRPLIWWDRGEQKMGFTYTPPSGGTGPEEVTDDPFKESETDSLFGSGSNQLPKMTRLINIHPVTAVWLLALLRERNKIQIQNSWEPGDYTPELLYLGWGTENEMGDGIDWTGKEAIPYGKSSHFVAVYLREFNHHTELTAISPSGERYPLFQGKSHKGVVTGQLPFTFWGEWKLEATGNQELFQSERLPVSLTGIKPQFANISEPKRITDSIYHWEVLFQNGSPKHFEGLITIHYQVADKQTKSWDKADQFQMSDDGEFLIGSDNLNTNVSKDFTFLNYYRKRDRRSSFKIAHRLISAVQEFRDACGTGVTIIHLRNSTGLSAVVRVGLKTTQTLSREKKEAIRKAINKAVEYLEKDAKKEKPTFSAKSLWLGCDPFSQFFHLEVSENAPILADKPKIADFAIPVRESNKNQNSPFSNYTIEENRYYTGIKNIVRTGDKLGLTFSYREYRHAQQRVIIRKGLLQVFKYFSHRITQDSKATLSLCELSQNGLELSFKATENGEAFAEMVNLLINLKTTVRKKGKAFFQLTVETDIELLHSDIPEEKSEMLAILKQHLGSDWRAYSCFGNLKRISGDSKFQIAKSLLNQLAFFSSFSRVSLEVKSLREDGTTLLCSPFQGGNQRRFNKKRDLLWELLENLKAIQTWENEILTLSIPEEKSGELCDRDSEFNQHCSYHDLRELQPPPLIKISHSLITAIDHFQQLQGNVPIRLNLISEDGLTAWVKPFESGEKKRVQLFDSAKTMNETVENSSFEPLEDTGEVKIQVEQAEEREEIPGNLILEFDAEKAFRQIPERDSLTEEQEIQIRFGLRCLNGGFIASPEQVTFEATGTANPIPLITPEDANDYIDHLSNQISCRLTTADLAFGEIRREVEYEENEGYVRFSIPLIGAIKAWKRFKPTATITVGTETFHFPYEKGSPLWSESLFEFYLPIVKNGAFINTNRLDETMEITIQATDSDVFPTPERTQNFEPVTPWVNVEKALVENNKLVVHYETNHWPEGLNLKLYLEKKNQKTEKYEPLSATPGQTLYLNVDNGTTYLPGARPTDENKSIYGAPDHEGVTAITELAAIPGGGEYRFLWVHSNSVENIMPI